MILEEQKAGAKKVDACRKHGISDATFYKYQAKYCGMDVSNARKLKAAYASLGNITPREFAMKVAMKIRPPASNLGDKVPKNLGLFMLPPSAVLKMRLGSP